MKEDLVSQAKKNNLKVQVLRIASTLFLFFISSVIMRSTSLTAHAKSNLSFTDFSEALVVLDITTDEFPDETQWTLINANDYTTLFSSQSLSLLPNSRYIDSLFVAANTCLRFIIEDHKNDGLAHSGSFKVSFDNELIIDNPSFTDKFGEIFNCKEGQTCEEAIRILQGSELLKVAANNWFVIRPIFDTYFSIRTISQCDTKLWLYSECGKAHPTDQTGSILFNDDLEEKQAGFTQVFLSAGIYYYLRVGNEPGCTENSFVEIKDLKLKEGCMDPASCNFDPTANLDSGDCFYGSCQPDIIVDKDILLESIYIDSLVNDSECLIEEGCLQGYGKRDLIRFTTQLENIGDADYIIGEAEENSSLFSEDNCHQHWHYLGYAEYLIFDGSGSPQPVGFKNGFCALDYRCKEDNLYKYSCDYMGISAGCYDTYDSDLLCQWIDVTDLPSGDYSLVVRVNYNRAPDIFGREESNYDNNWAQVCIHLDRVEGAVKLTILEDCPAYEDCMGIQYGRAKIDCEGVCGGVAHFGDLNIDGSVDQKDIQEYKQKISDQSIEVSSCVDLDGDGDINIYDLILLEDCIANNKTNESDPLHTHCDFPRSIENESDSVYIELTDVNLEDRFIQLSYSSNVETMAMDFYLDGLEIESIATIGDDLSIESVSAGGHVSFITNDERGGILKNKEVTPLLHIYYRSITDNSVCISEIMNIVNVSKEKVVTTYAQKCLNFTTTSVDEKTNKISILTYPNPASNLLNVSGAERLNIRQWYVSDQCGEIVSFGAGNNSELLALNVSEYSSGIYFLNIITDTDSYVSIFAKL